MKQSPLKRTLSVLLCLSLVLGFIVPIQAGPANYDVDLKRGISLVPQDLVSNEAFMGRFVRNNGETLSLNHLFGLVGSSNVKGAGSTLRTDTMKRNKSDYWWAKYQWTPNELEKQYLADANYPLIYEGNVVPDYCTHWIADDHWCKACVRLTSNGWNFGDVDRFGGNFHWYVASANSNSGSPQAVKEQIDILNTTTLTYAAYSQKQHNCGDPQVGGSVFYMVDTTVPYITDVSISGSSYQSLANGDVTGSVTLTFSEDIRFADNQVPEGLKLNLSAYYGAQAGGNRNENTSYPLSADFTSLAGNAMIFTFTVPQSVNHIYINGISNDQPILEDCELYVYNGDGTKISGTSLTSPTRITDLSGNYLRWDKSDKSCYTVTYDGVAPTLVNVSMSGKDISAKSSEPPTNWNANSGNNQYVYAGAGDTISFTVTYSESVDVPADAKAVLRIKDASGNPIELGIKNHRGNTVVFQDLTITEGMQVAGERIVIDSFRNMTVTDYAGNALTGDANKTPAQDITLDVDKPVISTKVTATDGVYFPYADTEGEYFTFPLKFTETKIAGADYSDISGKPIDFTLEMLDGDAYGYWWYIDNTQQVNKNATWISATTGTTKNTVKDIAEGSDYYLHIRLDKNTDYNYTADGGMDANGIYFNGKLTAYVEDWAGNWADPTSFTLKHQVDTVAPEIRMTARLRMEPNYGGGNVTFSAAFQATDNYNIERITYQWFYKLGTETDFTPREPVVLTGDELGAGLSRTYTATLSNTYDYSLEANPDNGACYLVVTAEDQSGKTITLTYDTVSFNFTKAKSTSTVVVNSATEPTKYPSVTLNAPTYEADGNYDNIPRTILLLPDTRNEGAYWLYDPWEYGHTELDDGARYGTDIFQEIVDFIASGSSNFYNDVPGWFYYVHGTVDFANNSGDFYRIIDVSTTISQTGCLSDLESYLHGIYGPLDLHLVTTSSLEAFSLSSNPTSSGSYYESLLDFDSSESVIDTYTVYLAGDMDYEVQNITVENEAVLNYTSGTPAKNLDNATVSFRLVNATDTEAVQYGLDFVDYANANVKLYYLGRYSDANISDNTAVIQTWDLERSSDGVYTLTVEPGRTVTSGWYRMVLTLPNSYTGETKTFKLGELFMDATVLDITMDGYYKVYDHEDMYIPASYGLTTAWDKSGLEDSYAQGDEIILGLDTAPEGWTMDTHLTFNAGGRSKDNDPLYWENFDVAPRIRVYNHTYNTAAGLEDASSGLWLGSDGRNGTTFYYTPYLAEADAENPYGSADSLKLPFLEGYNLLVYEIESINGTLTTKEITVNVFGKTDAWELDTVISSANGVGINSVTANAIYAFSGETIRFAHLDSKFSYYPGSYVFTNDMDTTTFYLIDNQGNLSTKDFALLDENGELVDIDGNAPGVSIYDQSEDSYGTFAVTIDAHDTDSEIDPRDLTLTFDAAYSAVLMGLSLEDPTSSTYELTVPVPLALDENGELLQNADGTYPVWESYETNNYGIYRTQVIRAEPTQEEMENNGYEDCVEVKVWGVWNAEFSGTVTMTANAEDSYGNVGSDDSSFYASAWLDISHAALVDSEDDSYCYVGCDKEQHVNIDKALTDNGELAIALSQPVAAIDGCGIRLPLTEAYSLGQHQQLFVTTAPMIVKDGEYTVEVTDLFGNVHTVQMYVYYFGELGIDVSYSTAEPTNQPVTVTAQATGEYDKISSITSDNGDVGVIDSDDPTKASITVSDNCMITIQTEDGMSRVVQVSNIDKVLDDAYIVYYDQNYNVLDPSLGAEAVTALLVCDTEVIYVTNGPKAYEFPLGSKKGDTYTFEYQDRAGNVGTITATLPCDLAAPEERDTTAPDILVNLFALVGGRYSTVANVANPDDGSELNGYLAEGKAQGFRLVFSINDVSATKVLIQPAGTEAPKDYASAAEGSTAEDAALTVSGRSASIVVSANTTFDVHIIDEYDNVRSVPGITITTIDNQAPVLTPRYEIGRDENGYAVVTATFYPSEEEKFEVITPLSSDVLGKLVQIGTEVVDEETGETVPIMATRYYHIFTENGTYSFTYQDEMGNIGTAFAEVSGLRTDAAVVKQVNWYGTQAPSGQSNVSPDKSSMVNRNVIARLRMNGAISDVKLYAYDPEAENHVGAPLDTALAISVSFAAATIELTYEDNVDQQIVVEFTASASGRKGYYVVGAVNCIDKEAPVVTVTNVQMASDNRSMVITFATNEETVMSMSSMPVYGTEHTWTVAHNKQMELRFTDKAGNHAVYTVTENAEVDALKLEAEFSLHADGIGATVDPLHDLKLDTGATVYLRVNKQAKAVLSGTGIGIIEADTWTALVLPNSAGLHILSLTDVSTGDLLQILVAAQPKDNVAPVIELDGATVLVTEDASVAEMLAAINSGVKVTDNVDTDPGYIVTGYPDAVEAGLYSLTYTATDAAGNVSTISRSLYIMAEGTPLLKINGEVGVPYGKVFLKNGGESTEVSLELINMEEMTGQPMVIKYRKGLYTTGQMKYYAETVENMQFTVTGTGHYTVYVRSQDRVEFVIYIYVEG